MKLLNIFNIFKKEKLFLPSQFALVKLNSIARLKGINDDENKTIEVYKKGRLIEEGPYSPEYVRILKEVSGIPVVEEILSEDEFEFDEVAEFGQVSLRK